MICFQEAFHQDATQILLDKLKTKYPYILYNIAPTAFGVGSGLVTASKYRITSARFESFKDGVGEDRLAPKGVLRCGIKVAGQQSVYIYNTHLQAMPGKAEAKAREEQMAQIKTMMDNDKTQEAEQVLVGDLNVAKYNPWGISCEDEAQPDNLLLKTIEKNFDEPFYDDHDGSGKRTQGQSYFLMEDTRQMPNKGLKEEFGTWIYGPHATANNTITAGFFSAFQKKEKKEGFSIFNPHLSPKENRWGTSQWKLEATTFLPDHMLLPKQSRLTAKVEVRNTKLTQEQQSASSDHLPLYGRLFQKPALSLRDEPMNSVERFKH